jgi:hypothetical protein
VREDVYVYCKAATSSDNAIFNWNAMAASSITEAGALICLPA